MCGWFYTTAVGMVVMIEGCLGGAGIGVLVAAKVKICVLVEISGLL